VTREVLPAIRKDGAYVMGEEKVRTGAASRQPLPAQEGRVEGGPLKGGWTWTRIGLRVPPRRPKGAVKETAGKALGDKKTQAEGQAERVEGKAQNTVGGVKDAVREATKKD